MKSFSVDRLLDQLISDDDLRERFRSDRGKTLASYPLSSDDREALMKLDVESLATAGNSIRANRGRPI